MENQALDTGGAIHIEKSLIKINNCIFKENYAKEGGAVFMNTQGSISFLYFI